MQARKTVRIVKTWTKLKTGLFGNVYSRKTIFDCVTKLKPSVAILQPGPSVSIEKGERLGDVGTYTDLGITGRGYRTAGD